MPDSIVRYCIIAMFDADDENKPKIVQIEWPPESGRYKVVVFDTVLQARSVVEAMGGGRFAQWDKTKEICRWHPKVLCGFNKIEIWTGYDPYDVNSELMRKGTLSEAHGIDWRYHVHQQEVWRYLIKIGDQNAAELAERAPQLPKVEDLSIATSQERV